jgi:hypothetical protein
MFIGHLAAGMAAKPVAPRVFGAPPPSVDVIAWSSLGAWIFIPWAAWTDRTQP